MKLRQQYQSLGVELATVRNWSNGSASDKSHKNHSYFGYLKLKYIMLAICQCLKYTTFTRYIFSIPKNQESLHFLSKNLTKYFDNFFKVKTVNFF
jgi:hypothetical protein